MSNTGFIEISGILGKGAQSITGDKGIELDLILLAVALVIIVAGPGSMDKNE